MNHKPDFHQANFKKFKQESERVKQVEKRIADELEKQKETERLKREKEENYKKNFDSMLLLQFKIRNDKTIKKKEHVVEEYLQSLHQGKPASEDKKTQIEDDRSCRLCGE